MKPIFLLSVLIASAVMAQEPDSTSAIYQMLEAERNFARASVMYGRNVAFTDNFAEESFIFTDKWLTNAKQFWKNRKATAVVLKWEPEFMDIADSRDFGISTGPWESQEYRPGTAPVSKGYFLTVWKKQADGKWQVILDAGSTTPAPTRNNHQFSFPSGADKDIPDPNKINVITVSSELIDRDKQFLTVWKNNPVTSTYTSFLAPEARIQINGHLPSTNPDTIRVWINKFEKSMIWSPAGCRVASSGDLGFTYGLLGSGNDSEKLTGHYVRIWRKQHDSGWVIIIEMVNLD